LGALRLILAVAVVGSSLIKFPWQWLGDRLLIRLCSLLSHHEHYPGVCKESKIHLALLDIVLGIAEEQGIERSKAEEIVTASNGTARSRS
jgi:hypothetical protein